MKKLPQFVPNYCILLLVLLLSSSELTAQKNVTLLDQLSYTEELSDIWGYVDTSGREYALVGVYNGVSIVDVDTPANIKELFFLPGPLTIWRDLKTLNGYAYVTNEASGGLQIIDMNYLPDSVGSVWWGSSIGLNVAHNLYIDENDYCYVFGCDVPGGEGAAILNLNIDPLSPVLAGTYGTYLHDGFVRGDTMWGCEINNGWFSVIDVSNKSIPTVLTTHATPNNFTHNCWLSDDGNTLFTTDERSSAYIGSYDVSDLSNIKELDRYQSKHSDNVIPHNVHFMNGYLVTSYYSDGVTVVDAGRPDNLVEIGYYDTSPISGDGYFGSWGAYPFLPSGIILASDIEEGLFVFNPQYKRACYLEGTVKNISSFVPINNVNVEILTTNTSETTTLIGEYKTGFSDAGNYDIRFSKPGFISKTITNVTLQNDSLTILNAYLEELAKTSVTGKVFSDPHLTPSEGANVLISNETFSYNTVTDADGNFTVTTVYMGTYNIYVAKWGKRISQLKDEVIDSNSNAFTFYLYPGIYDDFTFDFGWETKATQYTDGHWVRVDPDSTTFGGSPELNPENDVSFDNSNKCYVTGNNGLFDFVNSGSVTLTSPEFDITDYKKPYISYYTWFANFDSSGTTANDTMTVSLTNGTDTVVLETIVSDTSVMSRWNNSYINLKDLIPATNNMKLIFKAYADFSFQQLLEAGVDMVEVFDSATIGIQETKVQPHQFIVRAYPNPFNTYTTFFLKTDMYLDNTQPLRLKVYNLLGDLVFENTISGAICDHSQNYQAVFSFNRRGLSQGIYFFRIIHDTHLSFSGKLIIRD